MHANTAFGLARSRDWATLQAEQGDDTLRDAIRTAATRLFAADTDYPAHYEPSGADFLSGRWPKPSDGLVLPQAELSPAWALFFCPHRRVGTKILSNPAVVTDRFRCPLAQLEGLNQRRAAAIRRAHRRYPAGGRRTASPPMQAAAERHADASLRRRPAAPTCSSIGRRLPPVLLLGQCGRDAPPRSAWVSIQNEVRGRAGRASPSRATSAGSAQAPARSGLFWLSAGAKPRARRTRRWPPQRSQLTVGPRWCKAAKFSPRIPPGRQETGRNVVAARACSTFPPSGGDRREGS